MSVSAIEVENKDIGEHGRLEFLDFHPKWGGYQ